MYFTGLLHLHRHSIGLSSIIFDLLSLLTQLSHSPVKLMLIGHLPLVLRINIHMN